MNTSSKVYNLRRFNSENMMGLVTAKNIPAMSVQIAPISFWTTNGKYVEYEGGTSSDIQPQTMMARWTVVCLLEVNNNCYVKVVNGTASTSPELPSIPKNYLPLAAIYLNNGISVITNDIIYDVRNFVSMNNNTMLHANLLEPNQPNMHTIDAITGLRDELTNKLNAADLDSMLTNKADLDGTANSSWTLNKDNAGISTEDASIIVNRGSEPAVSIKWNEELLQWQFTNDGENWINFAFVPTIATTLVNGIVKLSVEGTDIAIADNDPRILDIANKANILDLEALSTIVDSKANALDLETLTTEVNLKANTEDIYTKGAIDTMLSGIVMATDISTALDLKADKANTYTKQEVNNELDRKVTVMQLNDVVDAKIANLVDSAPATLDTLNELATLLNNNTDLLATFNSAITDKADKTIVETLSAEVNLKADANHIHTDINDALAAKANTEDLTTLSTEVNLKANSEDVYVKTDVYTMSETDALLNEKANAIDLTTLNAEIDLKANIEDLTTLITTVGLKANADTVYTKIEADALLDNKANEIDLTALTTEVGLKANADTVYTKTEADVLLATKSNLNEVYAKNEIDTMLADVATTENMTLALDLKADKTTTYTKTEVDNALSYKASTNDILGVVDARINSIIDAAPESLNTLNEIAAALNDDANLASNLTNEIAKKANTLDVYTKIDVNNALLLKANSADVYIKTEVDNALITKANTDDVYTKNEINSQLADKADINYVDNGLAAKEDTTTVDTKLASKADATSVYTKTEIDISLLTPKTIYVDKNRTDIYTENGSMTKPFKTVQAAFDSIAALVEERLVIDIAPGVYEETLTLVLNGSSIRINLNEALLKGDFTLNDATLNNLAYQNKAGLKIVGIGVRSSYNDPKFTNNCIEGNFTYHTFATNNMQTRLDFVNSGIIGDFTAIGGGASRVWTFWINSRWSGLMSATTGANDCGIIVNAYNSNSSGSNSIGSASGKVAAYNLYNCVISGTWNVNTSQPGTWRNVIWKSNNDFTGYTGIIDVDSNSAASFLSKTSNITGITLTFADKAHTIAYTPTNLVDWIDPKPTTVNEAIDRLATAVKALNGGNAI